MGRIIVGMAARGYIMYGMELYLQAIRQNSNIDSELQYFLKTTKKRYVYGSDLQVAVCLGIFRDMNVEIAGAILPPGASMQRLKGYWGRLIRKTPIYSIQELVEADRQNAYVMMAVPREEYETVRYYLLSAGFADIIGCCWKHNSDIIDACYNVWRKQECSDE